METTEEMKKVFHSFYSQVSCTDLAAIQADCTPLKGGDDNMEGDVTLDWRADPFVSMSDLTLVVYDGTGGTPYHVHSLLMAYGGRKSVYIAEQIKNQQNNKAKRGKSNNSKRSSSAGSSGFNIHRQSSGNSNESSSNSAEYKVDIYVPAIAARHIPLFLDYIYGSTLKLTTSNAPSLRYLSNRFDCRDLHKEVTAKFIPQDLELNTAPQYCTHADELKDFELRDKSIRVMAERLERINVNALKILCPRMMRALLECDRLICEPCELSEKVAQYLRLRDDMISKSESSSSKASSSSRKEHEDAQQQQLTPLTDEEFYWLTHVQHMPKISPKEALFYFNYGTRYPQVMDEVGSGSLKSRCLVACSDSWAMDKLTSHLEHSEHNRLELYEELEIKAKVQLLESSLVGAKKLMIEKEKQYKYRNESDRDVQLSDEIMYKSNKEISIPSSNHNNKPGNVMKVVVLGAGVAPANGVYIYKSSSHHRGVDTNSHDIVYKKEAVWKNQKVTFVLYSTNSGQYYTQYKLGVRQNDHDRIRVLYNSPTVMGTSSSSNDAIGTSIPEQAWEVEDDAIEGLQPPPQFVGRMERQVSSTWNRNLKHSLP